MFKFMTKLHRDQEGATAIEYGLIAALVAIALISSLGTLSDSLDGIFGGISTTLDENVPGTEGEGGGEGEGEGEG